MADFIDPRADLDAYTDMSASVSESLARANAWFDVIEERAERARRGRRSVVVARV
jgi:hypothetical protein